jgi:hypothetical protein
VSAQAAAAAEAKAGAAFAADTKTGPAAETGLGT